MNRPNGRYNVTMIKDSLNKVFIWGAIPDVSKLHKRANGNTLSNNGVNEFATSQVWHYSKNFKKGKKPFSLIMITMVDDDSAIEKFLNSVAKSISDEKIQEVTKFGQAMCLPTGDIYE